MIKPVNYFVFSLMLTFILLPASMVKADSQTKVVFSCVNFPPSKFETPKDGLPGFVIEFLHEAFARNDIEVEFKFYPWTRALNNAMNGSVDGLCSCSYHPDRDNKLIYSAPLGENNAVLFYVRSDSPPLNKPIADLTDQKIGVVRGYNLHQELIGKNLKPTLVNNEESGIKLLLKKRIDLFYSFKSPGLYALSKHSEKDTIGYYGVSTQPYFACINKFLPNTRDIVRNLNSGLASIRKDGTYDQILQKYR
jgi:polar amino acid transport system substrate-binding protein